jgi:hypothetical protein
MESPWFVFGPANQKPCKQIQNCVKFTRLRRWSECTVYTQQVLKPVLYVHTLYGVWCTAYVCTAVILPSSPRWTVPRGGVFKMENENGKCEKMKMFLGPQSLVIWKRNCCSAQWNVRCSAGLPFNCAYCNFGAVLFCSYPYPSSLRSLKRSVRSQSLVSGRLTIQFSVQ